MKRSRDSGNPVSLFPFLAVLVSTMGALILLLLVISKRAERSHAIERAQRAIARSVLANPPGLPPLPDREQYPFPSPIPPAELASLVAPSMPDVPTLMDRRGELQANLRAILRANERKSRQLAEFSDGEPVEARRLVEVNEAVADAQRQLGVAQEETRRTSEKLRQLDAERDRMEQDVQRAKSLASAVDNRYRIIPYFGGNGTDRRPIYLECRSDRIVLMPEGVEIDAGLLADPSSPDNPLARLMHKLSDLCRAENSRPYPLLVVRPDGVAAYYVARMALATVEEEYGYELVDADVSLDFGEASPKWREVAQSSIADERRRRGTVGRGQSFNLESTLPPGVARSVLGGGAGSDEPGTTLPSGAGGAEGDNELASSGRNADAGPGGRGFRRTTADKKKLEEAGRALSPPSLGGYLRPKGSSAGGMDQPLPDANSLVLDGNSSMLGFQDPLLASNAMGGMSSNPGASNNEGGGEQSNGKGGGKGSGQSMAIQGESSSGNGNVNEGSEKGGPGTSTSGDSSSGVTQGNAAGNAAGAATDAGDGVGIVSRPLQGGSVSLTPQEGAGGSTGSNLPSTEFEQYLARNAKSADKPTGNSVSASMGQEGTQSEYSGTDDGSSSPLGSSEQMQSLLSMIGPTARTHSAVARRVVIEVRQHGIVLYPGERYVAFTLSTQSTKEAIYAHVAQQMVGWGKPKRADRWSPIVELNVRPDALDRYYDLHFALAGSGLEVEKRLIGWKDGMEFHR